MTQYAMVMDLNKCLGCHTCTIADKILWCSRSGMELIYWNNVETRPGYGYPRNWERLPAGFKDGETQTITLPPTKSYGENWKYDYKKKLFDGDGGEVQVMPDPLPTWGSNWDEDVGEGDFPNTYYFYLPRICNHCTNPACLRACKKKAIYKREEDGIVLIDFRRCKGLRCCVQACPYKKIYWNPVIKKPSKCIFCYPRIKKGVATACARQCPGRLRFIGEVEDKDSPIYKLVKKWKVALPLHPEFGTKPNVYYVPPISPDGRVPLSYLGYLFAGEKKVNYAMDVLESEREKAARGEKSNLIELLNSDDRYEINFAGGTQAGEKYIRRGMDIDPKGIDLDVYWYQFFKKMAKQLYEFVGEMN